jgi:hypothetical protein
MADMPFNVFASSRSGIIRRLQSRQRYRWTLDLSAREAQPDLRSKDDPQAGHCNTTFAMFS